MKSGRPGGKNRRRFLLFKTAGLPRKAPVCPAGPVGSFVLAEPPMLDCAPARQVRAR